MACPSAPAPLELMLNNNVEASDPSAANTASFNIGIPAQQLLLTPSLDATDITIYDGSNCASNANGTCDQTSGGDFDRSKSRSFSIAQYDNWNGTHRGRLGGTKSTFFNEIVNLGSYRNVPGVPGLIMEGAGPGRLPLGPDSNFVSYAFHSGVMASRSWGLFVGTPKVPGSLILGGYSSRFITGTMNGRQVMDKCGICATVKSMKLSSPTNDVQIWEYDSRDDFVVKFDPYEAFLTLPGKVFDAFIQKTNGTLGPSNFAQWNAGNVPQGDFNVNLGTVLLTSTTIPHSLLFTDTPPTVDGAEVVVASDMKVGRIRRTDENRGTLGSPYMSTIYMIYDDDRKTFNISGVDPTATSQGQFTPICPTESSQSKNIAAIIGGVIGAVALLVLLAAIVFFTLRLRKRRKRELSTMSSAGHEVLEIDSKNWMPMHYSSVSSRTTMKSIEHELKGLSHYELPTSPTIVDELQKETSTLKQSLSKSSHDSCYELPVNTTTQIDVARRSHETAKSSNPTRDDASTGEEWSSLGGPTLSWGGRTISGSIRTAASSRAHSGQSPSLMRDGKVAEQWYR